MAGSWKLGQRKARREFRRGVDAASLGLKAGSFAAQKPAYPWCYVVFSPKKGRLCLTFFAD
jgi:hypothetical protein